MCLTNSLNSLTDSLVIPATVNAILTALVVHSLTWRQWSSLMVQLLTEMLDFYSRKLPRSLDKLNVVQIKAATQLLIVNLRSVFVLRRLWPVIQCSPTVIQCPMYQLKDLFVRVHVTTSELVEFVRDSSTSKHLHPSIQS